MSSFSAAAVVRTLAVASTLFTASAADATTPLPHLTDPKAGAIAAACAKTLAKTGGKLIGATQKSLDGCASAILACVQTKPGDVECLAKARSTCTKQLAKIDAAKASLVDGVAKKCGGIAPDDLASAAGLGFGESTALVCDAIGEPLSDAASIGRCVAEAHVCDAEAMYGAEHPRAGSLLRVANVKPVRECLTDRGGDDEHLGDVAAGKALVQCEKGIAKASAAFTATRLAIITTCANKVYACVQTKPDDDTCIPKAKTACEKDLVKLGATPAVLVAAAAKACGAVPFGAIAGASGLDVGEFEDICKYYGMPLATAADFAGCLARQHTCYVENAVWFSLPRSRELFDAVGLTLFSGFCAG